MGWVGGARQQLSELAGLFVQPVSPARPHPAAAATAACSVLTALPCCLPVPASHCNSCCLQVKEQEEKLRQQLADMRAKEAETGSDIPGLIQERDECR